jgi:hypothetical protein
MPASLGSSTNPQQPTHLPCLSRPPARWLLLFGETESDGGGGGVLLVDWSVYLHTHVGVVDCLDLRKSPTSLISLFALLALHDPKANRRRSDNPKMK